MSTATPELGTVDVGAFFDGRAEAYNDDYDLQGWGGYVLRTRLQAVLDVIGEGPGDALDAGMGPGRLCEQLVAGAWTVSGVDISEEMVRHAQRRLPDVSKRLRLGRIERLPFDDASFDVAAATGVMEYVESVPDAFAELARVLRPGGRAVISVPNCSSMHGYSRSITDPMARLAKRVWRGESASIARRDRIPPLAGLLDILVDAGLTVTARRHVAALVIPAPFDRLMPATSQRLGLAFEHRPRVRKRVATQLVIEARKSVPAAPASAQR
jgi:ubiquinone/menaquinone biosynthesis C-methylase UbiE